MSLQRSSVTLTRRTTEMSWRRTTEKSLDISFETSLMCLEHMLMVGRCYGKMRRYHYVPLWLRRDVLLRRLGDIPPRRCWVFHSRPTSDVVGVNKKALIRRHDVLLPSGSDLNAVSQGANKKKREKRKLKRLDLSCFLVKNIFGDDGFQICLFIKYILTLYFNVKVKRRQVHWLCYWLEMTYCILHDIKLSRYKIGIQFNKMCFSSRAKQLRDQSCNYLHCLWFR